MKTSPSKKKPAAILKHQDFEMAYDLKKERRKCRAKGGQSKMGVAWIEHGRLKAVPSSHFQKQPAPPSKSVEMYERWLDEIGLNSGREARSKEPRRMPASSAKYRLCLIVSRGSSWDIWNYQEVQKSFAAKRKRKADRLAYTLPEEFTIYSTDLAPDVWQASQDKTVTERCLECARALLGEAASLYEMGCVYLEGFEEAYDLWKGEPPHELTTNQSLALAASDHLKNSLEEIKRMLYTFTTFEMRKKVPDAAVALRQGWIVGSWLAKARAILTNAESLKMASNQGIFSKSRSNFWDDLVRATENRGKSAKELFEGLRNKPDLDYPDTKLSIDEMGRLVRGNGSRIQFTSFMASLSRARQRRLKKN
ncbi:MAG: hypothetical protein CJBNEKGG_02544 [Prosthecobacter sp.]|nr:hypothetical protein [Prosthecobacter sp.]